MIKRNRMHYRHCHWNWMFFSYARPQPTTHSQILTAHPKEAFKNMVEKGIRLMVINIFSFPTTVSTVKRTSPTTSIFTPYGKKLIRENIGEQHFLLFQQCLILWAVVTCRSIGQPKRDIVVGQKGQRHLSPASTVYSIRHLRPLCTYWSRRSPPL